ncbi:phospholipase D family protein [Desulfobulbus alkaliphilus]|uniref:phospholipase D family protein n=1 Tax=Desulfobulbus alkaliphilus TaxID=869814 RepID=UPI0019659D54|nr:phospholipase D family protein [Desulfobulbus alkaliphilus]MBM9538831.1 phospholipase D family protein [Desulfobulbus alkaliphilus]
MTTEIITNKVSPNSTQAVFNNLANSAHKIIIAVAFFSDSNTIEKFLDIGIEVTLIVSLRPPTNYYSIKKILHRKNVQISFLGDDFHSKIYAFYDEMRGISNAIIGSSNFTNGGMNSNIETNVVIHDQDALTQIDTTLEQIIEESTPLQPDELNRYKIRYDKFVNYSNSDKSTIKTKISPKNIKIIPKASEYAEFWNVADKVKDLVSEISRSEYPMVPEYLVIDHFWHWIVKICEQRRLKGLIGNPEKRDKTIPDLFKEYCKWDKSATTSYTEKMGNDSKHIQNILSPKKISSLSINEALIIYRSFHAARSLIQRFGADEKFVNENSIQDIRSSFSFLLDEAYPVEYRIHELISPKGKYKLNHFGPSCVQELIGWAKPTKMPIRNNKADKAIRLLGFRG